jgi:predicted RNase H-like nuclease (RuvC/YqgF family)
VRRVGEKTSDVLQNEKPDRLSVPSLQDIHHTPLLFGGDQISPNLAPMSTATDENTGTSSSDNELKSLVLSEFSNLREDLVDQHQINQGFSQISTLNDQMNKLTETVESMKGEILEEINLNVKENYKLSVMDDKINSLRGEVDNMRSDIQQLREEFMIQTQALQILLLELPEKLKK